ncbi:MAG: hypothetical protein ACJAVR_000753 [Paracoccaceae bacterium]|jgi:hypothetical protein
MDALCTHDRAVNKTLEEMTDAGLVEVVVPEVARRRVSGLRPDQWRGLCAA